MIGNTDDDETGVAQVAIRTRRARGDHVVQGAVSRRAPRKCVHVLDSDGYAVEGSGGRLTYLYLAELVKEDGRGINRGVSFAKTFECRVQQFFRADVAAANCVGLLTQGEILGMVHVALGA